MLCQWWLLGVRNEAHDNVPGWVPLRVSHCYGNGSSKGFFFSFTEGDCCFFFSYLLCLPLPLIWCLYTIICKIHNAVYYCIFTYLIEIQWCMEDEQKNNRAVSFPQFCVSPTVVPPATVQPFSRSGCLEMQKGKMNWHERSFGRLIFAPLAFKVKWHERR